MARAGYYPDVDLTSGPSSLPAGQPPQRRYNTTPLWRDAFTAPNPSDPYYRSWREANPGIPESAAEPIGRQIRSQENGVTQYYDEPATGGGGTTNTTDPAAFIAQWQASHAPNPSGLPDLIAAMKAAGFNVGPYMYGSTASRNEISLNGQKYKVLGGEDSASPFWYHPGDEDGGGGGGFSFGGLDPALLAPWTEAFPGVARLPTFQAPPPANVAPFSFEKFHAPTLEEAQQEPGYQLALKEGLQALQNSAAGKGILRTGGTLKDLIKYGQAAGEGNYQNVFNRAAGTHAQGFQEALGTYGINYGVTKDVQDYLYNAARDQYSSLANQNLQDYQRAYQDYQARFAAFARNQDAPFAKALDLAKLGASVG